MGLYRIVEKESGSYYIIVGYICFSGTVCPSDSTRFHLRAALTLQDYEGRD